jgi:UPF0716 protein FxsA
MFLRKFLILGLVLIAAEVFSLAWVGARLGALATVLLMRRSSMALSALMGIRNANTRDVSAGTADGFAFALAGALLIMPGFFSDLLALGLILPWSRQFLGRWLEKHMSTINIVRTGARTTDSDTIIEGEAVEIEEPAKLIDRD